MISPLSLAALEPVSPVALYRRLAARVRSIGFASPAPEPGARLGDTLTTDAPPAGPVPAEPAAGAIEMTDLIETVPVQTVWTRINDQVGHAYFPGDLFVDRNTAFDHNVLTARYLHQHAEFGLAYRQPVLSLLAQAEHAALATRRVDQVMWLAQAYRGEFSDLPNAMYKAANLDQSARSLLASGGYSVTPYQYPHVNYGLVPYPGAMPGFNDPFGLPPALTAPFVPREVYERNRAASNAYWNMVGGR